MICQVHPLLRLRVSYPRWPLHGTRERLVRGVEGRLPHLREFVQDVRYGGLVSAVIHEDDGALVAQDQLFERRPIGQVHGDDGRHVGVCQQAGRLDGADEVLHSRVVAVGNEDRNNLVPIRREPGRDIGEVGFGHAAVQQVAGRVAEIDGVVEDVRLALQHANTIVELGEYAIGLVAGDVIGEGEGAVMRSDVGQVTVLTRAIFGMAVAGRGVCV